MATRCPSCSAPLPDDAAFCSECGAPMPDARPAPRLARLAAGLTDAVIVLGPSYAASIWFVADTLADRPPVLSGVVAAASYLLVAGYVLLRDAIPGGSLGKRVFGLETLDEEGAAPSPGRSVLRNLDVLMAGILFPIAGWLVLALVVLAGGKRPGEAGSHTRVVRGSRAGRGMPLALLAASVALAVLATGVGGLSVYGSARALLSREHGSTAVPRAPLDVPRAQAVVDRFYAAADSGDVGALGVTLTRSAREAFPRDALDSWIGGVAHEVVSVRSSGADRALVSVREDGNGVLGGPNGIVTLTFERVDGAWYIARW